MNLDPKYGKRIIPRNILEFEGMIYPYYRMGDYYAVLNLLHRYFQRKGKSARASLQVSPGIMSASFKSLSPFDLLHFLNFWMIGMSDFVYSRKLEFVPYFEAELCQSHGSIHGLLSKYFREINWILPNDLQYVYYEWDYYMRISDSSWKHKGGYKYGYNNHRIDILVRSAIELDLSEVVTRATKNFRVSLGLNPEAVQWKSEQQLFDELCLAFPNEVILSQGSPDWLEGQRFDVWFPERGIAVEYNGKQHYESVEYFGGEEGFTKTIERDRIKAVKCSNNDTTLIIANEGYSFDKLKEEISKNFFC